MTNEDKIYTTLRQIREHLPSTDGYKKLCKSLGCIEKYGEDTPVTLKQIYDSNGYSDTLWCLRAVDKKWFPLWRHFACDAADDVRHLMPDQRSLAAIDTARRYADGLATDEELFDARNSALAAAEAAASAAAWSASQAADEAAASAAASAAAWSAYSSADEAAYSAASRAAAMAAAWDTYSSSYKEKQMQRLFEYCRTGERAK